MRSLGDILITEPSNSRALAKRSGKTERQDKATTIQKKDGTLQQVRKYGK